MNPLTERKIMNETVVDLPLKSTSTLKRWSKRALVAAIATAVVATIYVKVNENSDGEPVNPTI